MSGKGLLLDTNILIGLLKDHKPASRPGDCAKCHVIRVADGRCQACSRGKA